MARSLHIRTYGCQMNVYDSGRMADVLAPLGYRLTEQVEDADMVILNTCHIREKAAEKVFSELGRLRLLKERRAREGGTPMVLAVAGCVAQAEGEEIVRRAPWVDMVFGPQSYHNLPEMVARAGRAGGVVLDVDFPSDPKFDHLPQVEGGDLTAFLAIQEGCDRFCTFCVVPYTRGAEYSRPVTAVVEEARRLAENGAREITLLGQNVNAFHGSGPDGREWGLGEMIRELAKIENLDRIRYTTSHPANLDDRLIEAHRDVEKLMPFLHLPLQSGSDRILAAMNRRHTADDYRRLIERLKAARPDIAVSSDFIVGFPGESEADFQATLEMARDIGFIQAYSFKYSPRPGTPAADLGSQVPEEVKSERLARLQDELVRIQTAFNRSCVGRVLPVLLDRPGRHPGQLIGRSPYMQPVFLDAPADAMGSMVDLRIIAGHANSLAGELADGPAWRRSA